MTTPVKQLHDENDAAFYPQTAKAAIADYDAPSIEVTENDPGVGVDLPANSFVAVVGEGPSFDDLVFADDPAEPENPSPWVTGGMIDFSTVIETVGSGDNICYKFADGRMLALVRKTASVTLATWGSVSESEVVMPPNFAQAFVSTPFCTVSIETCNIQVWLASGSGRTGATGYNTTATHGQGAVLCRTNAGTASVTLVWQAWGRWK